MLRLLIISIVICVFLPSIRSHGRLIEPPSRASAWRYGFNTPPNYNDHELYCGGFTRQWAQNGGKCGLCGDPWDSKLPRAHEYGGTYGQGVIVRNYGVGSAITIRVELTASHFGFFEFGVCSDYKNASQECLDKNILKLVKPQEDVDHEGYKFYPKEGNKIYEMRYKLPKMSCKHCILQWRYIAGNNWGTCPNGTGAVGCGNQEEFRACADISIGKGPSYEPTTEGYSTTTIISTTTDSTLPKPEESYNPFTAILITVLSFLVISLVLFLLYFHYYQVGRQVKNWVNGIWKKNTAESKPSDNVPNNQAPMPPPRVKRSKSISESGMQEVDLSGGSMA